MKSISILYFLLFLSMDLFSQIDPELIEVATNDRLFRGVINEKYEITLYLKTAEISSEHTHIYSVRGWYYYNSVQKKIPLVGIYDGDLVLYSFSCQDKQDSVLHFLADHGRFWDDIEYLKAMGGYDEMFFFENDSDRTKGLWQKGTRNLDVKLYDSDVTILKEYTLLKVKAEKENHYFSFEDLSIGEKGLEIVNFIENEQTIRFLFRFEMMSRHHVMGMCGAGLEIGYIEMEMDRDFNLIDIKTILIESCLGNFYAEELPESSDKMLAFNIRDHDDSRLIRVDLKNCKIVELE